MKEIKRRKRNEIKEWKKIQWKGKITMAKNKIVKKKIGWKYEKWKKKFFTEWKKWPKSYHAKKQMHEK